MVRHRRKISPAPRRTGEKNYFKRALINSSPETNDCSPVSIFFSIALPSFISFSPTIATNGTQLLFVNFGEKEAAFSMEILAKARLAGIRAEIFPDAAKMKKQMSYANAKNIPFVAIVGENEMNEGKDAEKYGDR